MGKKAVDVVLLPEEAIMDKTIEVNRRLVERFGRKIVLDKESCLPHISLAMGCVDEKDIDNIGVVLRTIAGSLTLGCLKIVGVAVGTNSVGEKVSAFVMEKTRRLQMLHNEVMKELSGYFSYDVTADMLYPSGEVSDSSLFWIKYFREKSSFAKFLPHITIGYGEPEQYLFPQEFAASRLALCHLGNHCTCRKILVSVELKRQQE